ncbi:hypothetical protein KOI35_15380 [Actinoplanes bogorensis]|uniref:Uncharacterized protein n=1 Tax=Paractinoplanes bogorensis TaxID=1610840 RepID=A0ABS5YN43_9ACTN|nr:hypothetical protein [Actinoplanes bogorensis]MBU2664884.1 hypothetical protein [Actinoplanes bogorensis]
MMRLLLDEPRVFVTYGSASLISTEGYEGEGVGEPWADESNGLCGAGVPGVLALQTSAHTDWLPFRIELHDTEPAAGDGWEEIVEVSFTALSDSAMLAGLDGDGYEFALPRGDYRVRYCLTGMEEDIAGPHLLQFWPAAPAPGRIVRQTGEQAAYWHRARRTLTPAEEQDDRDAEQAHRDRMARERWGDRLPNDRLRATLTAGLYLDAISQLDPDLEFALSEADDATHRRVAAWAALRSLAQAGLVDLPEIAPAVAALRRGEPAPPPFDDSGFVWAALERADVPRTSVPVPPDGSYEQSPQDWGITVLFHSAESDSLVAVLEVLVCLAYVSGRDGYRDALAEVRRVFPALE